VLIPVYKEARSQPLFFAYFPLNIPRGWCSGRPKRTTTWSRRSSRSTKKPWI